MAILKCANGHRVWLSAIPQTDTTCRQCGAFLVLPKEEADAVAKAIDEQVESKKQSPSASEQYLLTCTNGHRAWIKPIPKSAAMCRSCGSPLTPLHNQKNNANDLQVASESAPNAGDEQDQKRIQPPDPKRQWRSVHRGLLLHFLKYLFLAFAVCLIMLALCFQPLWDNLEIGQFVPQAVGWGYHIFIGGGKLLGIFGCLFCFAVPRDVKARRFIAWSLCLEFVFLGGQALNIAAWMNDNRALYYLAFAIVLVGLLGSWINFMMFARRVDAHVRDSFFAHQAEMLLKSGILYFLLIQFELFLVVAIFVMSLAYLAFFVGLFGVVLFWILAVLLGIAALIVFVLYLRFLTDLLNYLRNLRAAVAERCAY